MKTLSQISANLRGMQSPDYDQLHALADEIDAIVATPAEVTDDAIECAAKGMWNSAPRGVAWEQAHESIAADWRRLARAALAAQPSAVGVPEGYLLARTGLTHAIANALGYDEEFMTWEEMQWTWRNALLAAAPEPTHD